MESHGCVFWYALLSLTGQKRHRQGELVSKSVIDGGKGVKHASSTAGLSMTKGVGDTVHVLSSKFDNN